LENNTYGPAGKIQVASVSKRVMGRMRRAGKEVVEAAERDAVTGRVQHTSLPTW